MYLQIDQLRLDIVRPNNFHVDMCRVEFFLFFVVIFMVFLVLVFRSRLEFYSTTYFTSLRKKCGLRVLGI